MFRGGRGGLLTPTVSPWILELNKLENRRNHGFGCRLMASVKSWLGRARGVNQPRTNLKKMREVLHAGLRLAAEVPQVEQLRMDIRRREWEENGKKVLFVRPKALLLSPED
jgi:hypothetical protein